MSDNPTQQLSSARDTALLVMDYQPVVLDGLADRDGLIEATNRAIKAVRNTGGVVGFVRVAFDELDYHAVPTTNRAFSAVAANKFLREGSTETALHPDIASQPGDIEVRKTRVSAFSTTDLDERLTNLGVTTLILAGVHTSGVVLSTVREAADRDYRIVVLSDCVSDPNQDVHDMLINQILPRQAQIGTTADLDALLADS